MSTSRKLITKEVDDGMAPDVFGLNISDVDLSVSLSSKQNEGKQTHTKKGLLTIEPEQPVRPLRHKTTPLKTYATLLPALTHDNKADSEVSKVQGEIEMIRTDVRSDAIVTMNDNLLRKNSKKRRIIYNPDIESFGTGN